VSIVLGMFGSVLLVITSAKEVMCCFLFFYLFIGLLARLHKKLQVDSAEILTWPNIGVDLRFWL